MSLSSSLFPEPRSDPDNGSAQDIAFSMLEGDFVVHLSLNKSALYLCILLSYLTSEHSNSYHDGAVQFYFSYDCDIARGWAFYQAFSANVA